MDNSIGPIEISLLAARHSNVKNVCSLDNKYHTCNPGSLAIIHEWLELFE